jgi:hypothetical protein
MKLASCIKPGVSGLIGLMIMSCSPAGKKMKVAFVTNNAADFWTIARNGCEKADQELEDLEVEFRIPADGTAAEQKRILDDLLVKGVAGLAISPVDPVNQRERSLAHFIERTVAKKPFASSRHQGKRCQAPALQTSSGLNH